jgi:hypothetical protein
VALGETFEALVAGVQGALRALGGVPPVLRSDNLSASYKLPGVPRADLRSTLNAIDVRRMFEANPAN